MADNDKQEVPLNQRYDNVRKENEPVPEKLMNARVDVAYYKTAVGFLIFIAIVLLGIYYQKNMEFNHLQGRMEVINNQLIELKQAEGYFKGVQDKQKTMEPTETALSEHISDLKSYIEHVKEAGVSCRVNLESCERAKSASIKEKVNLEIKLGHMEADAVAQNEKYKKCQDELTKRENPE